MPQRFGVTEENRREGGKKDKNSLRSESPRSRRAVAALAQDPKIMKRTGQLLSSWELAREYRLTEADGTRPHWGKAKLESHSARGVSDSRDRQCRRIAI